MSDLDVRPHMDCSISDFAVPFHVRIFGGSAKYSMSRKGLNRLSFSRLHFTLEANYFSFA